MLFGNLLSNPEPKNELVMDYLESDGNLYYFKVTNNTLSTVSFVKVRVSLLDSSDDALVSDWGYAVGGEGLDPGDSDEFSIYIDEPKDGNVDSISWSILKEG